VTQLPSRPIFRSDPELLRRSIDEDDELLAKKLGVRPWAPANLRGPQLLALDNAATRASIDLHDPGIAADLERVACLGAALFGALAAGEGQQIEAPLPGSDDVVKVTGVAADSRIGHATYWRDALLAALAVRNERAVTLLAEVPVALLRQLTPAISDWTLLEYEALQALALRRSDAAQLLTAAARAADPDTVDEFSRDWVLDIVTPELQLGFRALDNDQAAYDSWMLVAIKCHHHYYQSDAALKKQPMSQLALAPLAMACVAHDLGIHTNVTTDYLPSDIIDR